MRQVTGILGKQGIWAGNESACQKKRLDTARTLRVRCQLFYELHTPSAWSFDTPWSYKRPLPVDWLVRLL